MMKTKNKSFLSRLFSHNITLFILAFIVAFSAWFIIKITSGEDTPKTIKNIPITIELPESVQSEGLKVFGLNQKMVSSGDTSGDGEAIKTEALTATVEVSGNPIIVAGLSASDIKVSPAQTTTITGSGTYTLPLSARKASIKSDYDFNINNLTPSSITVYVDAEKEEEFQIENQITVKLADSNHYANVSLSDSTVTVSGPKTHVNKIESVAVVDTVSAETQTIQENLVFLDENGEKLDLPYVTTDVETVEVSVSVQPISTVDLKVDVKNAPENYPEITISPSTLKITGPQATLQNIENNTITIGTLNFEELNNENKSLKYDITLPEGCKSTEKITSADVSIDLSSYDSKTISAKVASNLDSDAYTVEFVSSNNVNLTIYGDEDDLSELSASDITVVTDFTGLLNDMSSGNAVSKSVPLNVKLSKEFADTCWVYDPPTINVNVTKK